MKFPLLVLVLSMLSLSGCRETSVPTGFAGDGGLIEDQADAEANSSGSDSSEDGSPGEDSSDGIGGDDYPEQEDVGEAGNGDSSGEGLNDDGSGGDGLDVDGPDGDSSDEGNDGSSNGDGSNGETEALPCDRRGERVCDGGAIYECRGGAWTLVQECETGETCDATSVTCTNRVCDRGESRCVDCDTVQFCESDGAAWMPPQPCGNLQACLNGSCVGPYCAPSVMFLVDRSRSMAQSWSAVRNSIHHVAGLNQGIGYGLTVFPSREEVSAYHSEDQRRCSVGDDWPNVPILNDAEDSLRDYFDTHTVTGSTPLERSLRHLAANPDEFWPEGQGGYLIVITDGEDTCTSTESCGFACVASQLGDHTRSLLQQGIKTYAVGYNYEGNRLGLSAIAQNGGTTVSAHLEVGSELGLTTVLQGFMLKIKACL